jgi:RNA polymerase sigma factor (sigma-70 family)
MEMPDNNISPTKAQAQLELWLSVQSGDHQSFRIFYMTFTDILYNYGLRICPDQEIVKDSIQDLFQLVWEKRESIIIKSSVKHYLLTVLKRDLIKKSTALQKREQIGKITDFELSVETKIVGDEAQVYRHRQLNAAIEMLTVRQKEILFLRYYENLSYEEISALMNLNKNSMYKLLSGAIQRIKSYLLS